MKKGAESGTGRTFVYLSIYDLRHLYRPPSSRRSRRNDRADESRTCPAFSDAFSAANPSYRVRRLSEWDSDDPDIRWNGTGNPNTHTDNNWNNNTTYTRILNDIRTKGILKVAVIGHSHGGALARRIVERLHRDHTFTDLWNVTYSAYVDAVKRDQTFDENPFTGSETRRPLYDRSGVQNAHESYYNTAPGTLFGNPYHGGIVANSGNNPFSEETHFSIDNDPLIHDALQDQVEVFVTE